MAKHSPRWKKRPDTRDFEAAANYLTLQFPAHIVQRLIKRADRVQCIERIAKDLLRASRLPLLPSDELHVAENIKKIRKKKPLSPIITVQGDLTRAQPFVIADGYHRMCAACHENEDAPVSCVMITLTR